MKQLILFVGVLLSLIGCLDDQTKMGENAISYLSFKSKLDTVFFAERMVEFTIDAPEIEQKNQEKALTYEWQVNFKVVSTEKTLTYTSDTCGLFLCRLKISNEDGAIFQNFNLRVPYPYDEGILIMSKYDDRTMISFRSDIWPERGFEKDVYAKVNPVIPLGKEPVAVVDVPTKYYTPYVYITTANPFKLVKLDYNTLEALEEVAYPEEKIDRMVSDDYSLYLIEEGKALNYSCKDMFFSNNLQQQLTGKYGRFPNAVLSDRFVIYGREFYRYQLVFDMANQVLFSGLDVNPNPIKYMDKEIKVKQIYDMVLGVDAQDVLILLEDQNGESQVVYVKIAHKYNSYFQEIANFDFKSIYTAPAGLNARSVFASSKKENILYYTIGNEIYRYNYLSSGNFPTLADYTVGTEGSIIKKIVLNENKSELYVAVDAPDGEYRGAVYCYNIDTKELIWKEEGVGGEIVEMLYKPRNRKYDEVQ